MFLREKIPSRFTASPSPRQARRRRGSVAAAVLAFAFGSSMAEAQCTSTSRDPYLDCALESYQSLQTDIQGSTNYWQVGNVIDTMFDFLAMPELTDAQVARYLKLPMPGTNSFPNCPRTLAPFIACQYQAKQFGSLCWYDDWGWWGIASSKAFLGERRYQRIFGNQAADFQQIARSTWDIVHRGFGDGLHFGAPNVWQNRNNQIGYLDYQPPLGQLAAPRFQGGVWQYELYTNLRSRPGDPIDGWTAPLECSVAKTGNPDLENLGPFQDTVENGLYLVHAMRLAELDPLQLPEYATAAKSEHDFLTQWFAYDQGFQLPSKAGNGCPGDGCSNETSLLQLFPPGGGIGTPALVSERVSTYAAAAPGGPFPPVRGWSKEIFWTGDQGLMLGGLIDYARAHPEDAMSLEVAQMILKGVMQELSSDHGLEPFLPVGSAPQGDFGDYESGDGIFMRYLLYAYQAKFPTGRANPIPALVNGEDFQKFLAKSAKAAYCQFDSQSSDMFGHFNVLATMVTARELLLPSNRPSAPPSCP